MKLIGSIAENGIDTHDVRPEQIDFRNEVDAFGNFLRNLKINAEGYQVSALLLAAQCQDFSIGLLSLKDSLVLSSRLTLLRGLYEASMRLNYVAIKGEAGALNLEYTDLSARVRKFDLAKKNCPELECSQIADEKKRLGELKCAARKKEVSDVLATIVDKQDSADYWLYRDWSGLAHSELFELRRHAVKSNSGHHWVTSLTCTQEELVEIYKDATLMLKRAGNCLVEIFKVGGNSNASQ